VLLGVALGLVGAAVMLVAYGLFEAQWVRLRREEVPVAGLPAGLDGFRLLHLSDFHLGRRSPGALAFRRAIAWAEGRDADLVAITGDLLSSQRGADALVRGLARLRARHGVVAVLGNHEVGVSRDPLSGRAAVDLGPAGVTLLDDGAVVLAAAGVSVQVAGISPAGYLRQTSDPAALADRAADLRILLCHFPRVVDRFDCRAYGLVLAGHMHGGQICLPYPGGKVRLAHLGARYPEGTFRVGPSTLVVSRGLGTTFVPLRFCARPEAVELVLRARPT
jgi:predicted MPP superfamily phosphohydrolase